MKTSAEQKGAKAGEDACSAVGIVVDDGVTGWAGFSRFRIMKNPIRATTRTMPATTNPVLARGDCVIKLLKPGTLVVFVPDEILPSSPKARRFKALARSKVEA